MCQNLSDPPLSAQEVISFINDVRKISSENILFLEEAVGPTDIKGFKKLKENFDIKICGGEIITTQEEMISRINLGTYDFVQPDASVIGGIQSVLEIFNHAKSKEIETVVHAWGGPVAIMANYHACFAAGGKLVELPMIPYDLEPDLFTDQRQIEEGFLIRP